MLTPEEIKELRKNLEELSQIEPEIRTSPEMEEELQNLRKELAKKDLIIEEMKKTEEVKTTTANKTTTETPRATSQASTASWERGWGNGFTSFSCVLR